MNMFRGVVLAAVMLPSLALAQVPVFDAGGNRQGSVAGSPGQIQPQMAGLSAEGQLLQQLYQLQQEVSMLRGLLEEQEHRIQRMERDQLERYQDLDRRLAGGGTSSAAQSPAAAGSSQTAVAESPADTAQGSAAATPDPEREKLMYEAAFDLVRARDFEKAVTAFTAFLRRYPDSEYAGNAQYWLGEVYLVQNDLDSAGRAFAGVLSRYAGHRKEADAMYKLADVERRLGNTDKARELYREVLSRHAGTTAAQLARRDLDAL